MSCRLDKFVWSVRLQKTRTKSTQAVEKGKVRLNGQPVKPSKEIKIGDEIHVIRNNATFSYKVLNLLNNRVGAKLVEEYIIDITPEEERVKYKLYQSAQRSYSSHGAGKPSKKDRRNLNDFLEDW